MQTQPPGGNQPPRPMPFAEHGATPAPPGGPVFELSGWWRRAGALFIDSFIVGALAMLIAIPLDLLFDANLVLTTADDEIKWGWQGAALAIQIALYLSIVITVMVKTNGSTPGKLATGIRVVREDGAPITIGYAVKREFLVKSIVFTYLTVFTLGIVYVLDNLAPLWDEQNRAWHDRMAKSRVVRRDAPAPGAFVPMPGPAPGYAYQPMPPAPSAWGEPQRPEQYPPGYFDPPPGAPPFPHAPPPQAPAPPPPQAPAPPGFENPVPPDNA
ncbi:MAG: RDD family protein [Solirubrobacterales bacterium]